MSDTDQVRAYYDQEAANYYQHYQMGMSEQRRLEIVRERVRFYH